jgi:hypothetical protein
MADEDAQWEAEGGEDEYDTPLTSEQKAAVAEIESHGFKLQAHIRDTLTFRDNLPLGRRAVSSYRAIEVQEVATVRDQFSDGLRPHGEYLGVVNTDGLYTELVLRATVQHMPTRMAIERNDWHFDPPTCGHSYTPFTIYRGPNSSRAREVGFHVSSRQESACIEISPCSPIASFLGRRFPSHVSRPQHSTAYSIKVFLASSAGKERDSLATQDLVDRMLFELEVRNGVALSLSPREPLRLTLSKTRPPSEPGTRIRFPSTRVPREVAALFSFAGEAIDNPPFVFLSYYQVLEYFLPLAARRDGLKAIRRELRDFTFNAGDDASVLRVLNAVERSKSSSEEEQMKVLVRECVRKDILESHFRDEAIKSHFSKNGPISGIPAITFNQNSGDLSVQVAKRIYALRNRIVHAKDDPKYSQTPVLLPRSREAGELAPDIKLARLLAEEVVIDSQD